MLADEHVTVEGLLGKVFDIHVCVCGQLFQHWFDFCLKGAETKRRQGLNCCFWTQRAATGARTDDLQAFKDGTDLLEGLGHVEADVGHLVIGHLEDHWQHLLCGDFLTTCF